MNPASHLTGQIISYPKRSHLISPNLASRVSSKVNSTQLTPFYQPDLKPLYPIQIDPAATDRASLTVPMPDQTFITSVVAGQPDTNHSFEKSNYQLLDLGQRLSQALLHASVQLLLLRTLQTVSI